MRYERGIGESMGGRWNAGSENPRVDGGRRGRRFGEHERRSVEVEYTTVK